VVDAVAELLSPPKGRSAVRRVNRGRVPPGQERLSIIVLTCNHAPEQLASTQCCLDAVRGFTTRPFELIVVDNGSDEETVAWLRQQPDLRVHFLPENQGVITGRNLGASLARHEYLVFLDNDQYVRPGWDEELLRLLQGSVVLAGVEQWCCRPEGGVGPTWQRDLLTYVGAGGMMIERTAFAELGGFDELFSPAYAEDPDLCWRAQERGYDFAWCRKALIDHAGHLTLGRPTEPVVEHLRRLRSRWASRFAAVRSG
jgi:GT2 family glycosyltransferase